MDRNELKTSRTARRTLPAAFQPPRCVVVATVYNPLQKLAYTSTIFLGLTSTLTGLVLYKPVQLWWLAFLMGGFVAFIPGHLIMVTLHGWNNFYSMVTGWKRDPE